MRFLAVLLFALFPAALFAAETEVVMYGASWCGPCGAVKGFLTQNAVPFEYVDIDTDQGRERYEAARGGYRGIPLTVIRGQSIRGANLEAIAAALQQSNVVKGSVAAPKSGGETYGGHPPMWWQAQFRQLRATLARIDQEIAVRDKSRIDSTQKDLIVRLKDDREIVSQSIDQLEVDASNVSLPRKYRE
jgi:mycoredoxin